jgi:hypothetical protein
LPSAEALTSYEADRSSDDGKKKKCCSIGVPTNTSRLVSPHALRLAKILLTTSLAAFTFIVAHDNGGYYGSNYEFVRHVLSMDPTFPTSTLRTRAITNPALWNAAYIAIITTEALTGLSFAKGAYDLLRNLRAPRPALPGRPALHRHRRHIRLPPLVCRLRGDRRRILLHVAIHHLEGAPRR